MTSRTSRLRKPRGATLFAGTGRARISIPALIGAGAIGLGALALLNRRLADRVERRHPPVGRFVEIDGVRLHYIDEGEGEPLVLLHGNGMSIEDFCASGLVAAARRRYRVIAFDRPGFGHSTRPRSRIWSASAQAELIDAALVELGITDAVVLGHSWGCSVAVQLALRSPERVRALVLESGYYFPSVRADVAMSAGPAIPLWGDLLRFTLSPVLARAMWPLLKRKIFGPAPVPAKFTDGFPAAMAFRPSQIRAGAADAALMIPDAVWARGRYPELALPVVIVAGHDDRVVDVDDQSGRLHGTLPDSTFHRVPGAGHMVHQTATERVLACIDEASSRRRNGDGDARRGRPNRAQGLLQPGWREVTKSVNGLNLHVVEAGRPGDPLLVLLHGFPEFWWAWRKQITPLAEAGFHVVVPDTRGYNESDAPGDVSAYELDILAADVVALADTYGVDRFHLAGHDWGAVIGWWVAARHASRLTKVVLMDGPHPDVWARQAMLHPTQALRSTYVAFFQLPWLPETTLKSFEFAGLRGMIEGSAKPDTFEPGALDRYVEAWAHPGSLTAMLNYYRALRLRPRNAEPARLTPPVLILWAGEDAFLERHVAEAGLALCDDGRLEIVDDASHWLHLEQPDHINRRMIEFFAQ